MVVGHDPKKSCVVEAPEEGLRPGDQLFHGQYRIDKYLSAGGFGITYLAMDSLNRKVVIKECFPISMCCRTDGVVRARSSKHQKEFQAVVRDFRLEALRMAKLKHPNIVGVHQVFEDNSTAYMALDFVEGRDLLEVIEGDSHALDPANIKSMLLKLLDAVVYIHEHDVLHRDIAPDNILLDMHGNPVLIDFGAAREVATRASRVLSALHVVKDGYSPQEFYITDGKQTESSDIYSLAATFYHLITGSAPPNSQVRLAALAADETDPYVPIPPRLEGYDSFFLNAVDKALAVFPKHRLQTAVEWIEEIDRERRQKAMAEKAKKDEAITLSIRQLTEETNQALKDGETVKKPAPVQRVVEALKEIRPAASPPTPVPASRKVSQPVEKAAAARVRSTPLQDPAARPEKVHTKKAASGPETLVVKTRLKSRRRSLLNRIVSGPIALFSSSWHSEQDKSGGV